jgi:hypothetical protein
MAGMAETPPNFYFPRDTHLARDEDGRYFPVEKGDPRAVATLLESLEQRDGKVFVGGREVEPYPRSICLFHPGHAHAAL